MKGIFPRLQETRFKARILVSSDRFTPGEGGGGQHLKEEEKATVLLASSSPQGNIKGFSVPTLLWAANGELRSHSGELEPFFDI